MSLTSGWRIAKGGKGALFYSRIAVNAGKVIVYNSLYLHHKSLHKSWLFRIYDWTCYAVAKFSLPHSKYFDMCEKCDCQIWSMFTTEPVLCTLHFALIPPPFQNVYAKNRKWGYVPVHMGPTQPCPILLWATLYGKKYLMEAWRFHSY